MSHSLLKGGLVTSLVAIQMACIVSFFFYQGMGMGFITNITSRSEKSKLQLRSSGRSDDQRTSDIPSCARDVFVTLHNKEGDENEPACTGLLIRDDIIITSSECSKLTSTFHFAGVGDLQAVPHTSLNEQLVDSRLGFLEASPPYHYHFIGRPVRRTRMFLSQQSNVTANGTAAAVTCDDHKPIAHNLPVDGEMVPLRQLKDVLPDEILWVDTDIDAPMLRFKSYRWWNRRVHRIQEEFKMKQWVDQYYGPPGSISIPEAHDDFIEKVSGMCEVMDPRGHRRDCFENYLVRWIEEKPFSGMHFFDWLDYGNGKWLLEMNAITKKYHSMSWDEDCQKKEFNRNKVHYFKEEERQQYEVYFTPSEDGKELIARYKRSDELVPESDMDDPHLYMWDLNETFYIVDDTWDDEKYDIVKHSGLMAGRPALSGGKAYFGKNGAVWGINFSSGHYRPDIQAVSMMYQWMKNQEFNLTSFHWVGRDSWSTESCEKKDWERIQIPGYTASELKQACRDVTVNPTWMLKDDV